MTKQLSVFTVLSALSVGVLATACGGGSSSSSYDGPMGRLGAALTVPPGAKHDVAGAHYVVVPLGASCSDPPVAEVTTSIHNHGLIDAFDRGGTGQRPFLDGLMVLPPGEYTVCVTPLQDNNMPSEICDVVRGEATVYPEQTTEIELWSQCNGVRNGALDVVVGLNDPPVIDNLVIGPSKFITTCDTATITVTASDPNGDELTYHWTLLDSPADAYLTGNGTTATFTTERAGSYQVRVEVRDFLGAVSSLTFPIHVAQSDVECSVSCPAGTVEAADACWIVGNMGSGVENGRQSCARAGLIGAPINTGVSWTAELMAAVTSALGCTNLGVYSPVGSIGTPSLYWDRNTNECFTPQYSDDQQSFRNASIAYANDAQKPAVHMCQKP